MTIEYTIECPNVKEAKKIIEEIQKEHRNTNDTLKVNVKILN